MSTRTQHPMAHFDSHDDQDLKDLEYGKQLESCKRFAETQNAPFKDASITKDWSPEQD